MADSPAAGKERRTATATAATGSAADDSDPSGDPSGGGSADDQASRSAFFSVRIITIDYYMIKPVAGLHVQRTPLTAQRISKLPVVRVFGTTPGGQKTCLHLHGLFPYFLLPCTGRGGVWEGQPLGTWENRAGDIANFVDAIDAAIRVTLWGGRSEAPSAAGPVGPVPTTMDAATAALPRQFQGTTFVYNVTMVRAKRFYGYHAEEEPFLKMFFLNPAIMTKAVNLLRAGAIKGRRYLPHDAHIPFHLQACPGRLWSWFGLKGGGDRRIVAIGRAVRAWEAATQGKGGDRLLLFNVSVVGGMAAGPLHCPLHCPSHAGIPFG